MHDLLNYMINPKYDPLINENSDYFISSVGAKMNLSKPSQIIEQNKETIFKYEEKVGTCLSNLNEQKAYTVWTYNMKKKDGSQKRGFQWLAQLVNNLFHLSENLKNEREQALTQTITTMKELSTQLHQQLQFKFKSSQVKTLNMQTIDESIMKMEEVLKTLNNAKSTHTTYVNSFQTLYDQIVDIINQMKNLRLHAVENDILEQINKNDFSIDTKIFQTLNTLKPGKPNGEEADQGRLNYDTIKTKYDQLCTFKGTCTKLNELKNAKTSREAYASWSGAKEDLETYGGNGETAKLLAQLLDKTYAERIKATSQDIKDANECLIKGTEMPEGNLQKARQWCTPIYNKHHKAEALSTYIDDLENGIDIGNKLSKLNGNISNLKDRSASWTLENFNTEYQKMKSQITELDKQLEKISDEEIKKTLNGKLSGLKKGFDICKKTRAVEILKNTFQSAIPRTSSETYENIKQALDKENENLNAMNNTFKEVIRNNFQGFIKTTLLQHKITPQNKEVFLNKQYKDILSRMKTTFDKTMDGLATGKAKAECQKAYDAMKKEMRDMYVDCYKAIRTLQKATSQNFLKINTATKQSIRNVPNQKNSLKNTSNIQNNVSKLPISSGKSEKQAIENFDKFLNHMLNEANERIMNKNLNAFGEKLNNVFNKHQNAQKTDAFNSIKQEANIQGAKKELDTALTELHKNLDKEFEANRSKMDALNAQKTLSKQDKEMLRTGYKQAHVTENLSLCETYKQKVYDTIDTLKKNTPSLSADELEQLEYNYLSAAGMRESARTHKTD